MDVLSQPDPLPIEATPAPRVPLQPHDVRLSEVLGGLSYALDLTEGQRPGHAARSCLIGMRIAEAVGLDPRERSSLFYALLMKDLGCSSNAARFAALFGAPDHEIKYDIKYVDWAQAFQALRFMATHVAPGRFALERLWRLLALLSRGPDGPRELVRTRCEQGADIASMLGLGPKAAAAIRALDEHWDGGGQPYGTRGQNIPILGRILGLAQTVEVFWSSYGAESAFDMAAARRGTWFDPELVDALFSVHGDTSFWRELATDDLVSALRAHEPADQVAVATDERLDLVAEAFARVIDAKSPWTYQHSNGVAELAGAMGRRFGMQAEELRQLRRAALLHDIGKLGVSSLILDKPGKLTDEEMAAMRRHPAHTHAILERVSCFRPLAESAAAHHERLDGRGYHRGHGADLLDRHARILAAADICDALRASRPYRDGLPSERILDIMGRDAGTGIDRECYLAVQAILLEAEPVKAPQAPAARVDRSLEEDYTQAA
jgi:putative nucleotidyltransferase with HDIG domain